MKSWSIAVLAATLTTTLTVVGSQQPQAPADPPAPAPPSGSAATPASGSTEVLTVVEEPATPVFARMCIKCHTPDRVLSQRRTRTQWEEILEKMTKLGAMGSDEEWETVQTYLLKHYGRINVNRAPADDLVLMLDVSAADAAAIVAFRKEKGEFADFEAVTKVPGISIETLQRHRMAIAF